MEKKLQPLTKTQQNMPSILGVIGIVLMMIGYGYQTTAKCHPEVTEGLGNAVDWSQIAGILIAMGGVTLHKTNNEKNTAAIEAAAKSAPVDDNGDASVELTVSHAVAQALSGPAKNPGLAKRLVLALHPDGDGELPALPKGGAA